MRRLGLLVLAGLLAVGCEDDGGEAVRPGEDPQRLSAVATDVGGMLGAAGVETTWLRSVRDCGAGGRGLPFMELQLREHVDHRQVVALLRSYGWVRYDLGRADGVQDLFVRRSDVIPGGIDPGFSPAPDLGVAEAILTLEPTVATVEVVDPDPCP